MIRASRPATRHDSEDDVASARRMVIGFGTSRAFRKPSSAETNGAALGGPRSLIELTRQDALAVRRVGTNKFNLV
eukprot:1737535-Pyramimonas_sp.AAC.1